MCHTCHAQNLHLTSNKIGDAGVTALANACAGGALAKCTHIDLSGNPASEEAKLSVRDTLKRRWLDGEFLAMHFNDAIGIDMSAMKWGDAEMTQLAAALEYCHARGAMAQLQVTWPLTVLIPRLETWRTRSPCLTVSFDVPYVPYADA